MPHTEASERLPRLTRWVAAAVVPVLLLAFALLYGFPRDTATLFAWPIKPPMTALVLGAGYLAGTYYFIRVFFARRWHTVAPTMTGIAVFTTSMLLATILHWNRFTHSHPTFWLWFVVYVVTPPLVWWLVFKNRPLDRGEPEAMEATVPALVRGTYRTLFLLFVLVGGWLFLAPSSAMAFWPWAVSPLTARILGGWLGMFGFGGGQMSFDARWSAWRITLQTSLLWFSLSALAALRTADSFPAGHGRAVVFWVVGLLLAGFGGTYVILERRRLPARATPDS